MAFNLTALGFDQDVFTTTNSVLHILTYLTVALPACVLIVVCIVILLFAKTVNWQLRMVLINIFVAEFLRPFGQSFDYLGYPSRASHSINTEGRHFSCTVDVAFRVFGFLSNQTAVALYAVVLYVYIKYGSLKKFKLCILICFMVISWVVYAFIFLLVVTEIWYVGALSRNSFCVFFHMMGGSISVTVIVVVISVELFFWLIVVYVFCLLTYCYVKNNAIHDDQDVKKAMMKILMYHLIKMTILLVRYVLGAGLDAIGTLSDGRNSAVFEIIVEYVVSKLLVDVFPLLTAIVSLCFLQPLHSALTEVYKKACSSCKRNRVHPSTASHDEN